MEDVNRAKDAVGDKGIVMASLSGVTLDEWQEMVGLVNETNADWVELNVSCPFAADMGVKMGAGAVDMTADVVRTCANLLKKPFSVKVSPQTVDQSSVALACQEAGAQCINLSARFSGFDLDIDQARPVGPGAQGGWGGPYFIGYGLKNCALAANKLSIPIIAGLGVWDWRDIIKYTMVGASLVQSGVGIMLQGYDVAKKWNEHISQWLDARGYSSLDDIRGIALPNVLKTAQVERAPEGVYAKVDYDKCTKCGVCKRSCFYDAITLTKCGAVIDQHKCDGCGMCMEVCPANAVSMTSPQKRIILAWWHEFYRQAGGDIFLSTLSERDRQLADLLNAVPPPPNGFSRILLLAGSCLPGQKGRYYSCKRILSTHLSDVPPFSGLPEISGQRPD